MLADCYGIQKVFLVECKSDKLKADRCLRQKQQMILEHLRIDIEDLNLDAIESLRGVPYLAIGKHLCGPVTDLTLRCCLPKQCSEDGVLSSSNCNLTLRSQDNRIHIVGTTTIINYKITGPHFNQKII